MRLLDGQKLATEWGEQIVADRPEKIGDLSAILIGDNPASLLYLRLKEKAVKKFGIGFQMHQLPASVSRQKVRELIDKLNADSGVAGIIVQLPLPAKFLVDEVVNWVDPAKDVDGLSDASIAHGKILPATARGIIEILRAEKISVQGKRVALIGFTRLLNVPLSIHLARAGATVTVLQEGTKDFSLLRNVDIIITAVGKRNLIRVSHVKQGVVVIDAGIVKEGDKLYGDVDFPQVSKKAGAITPVPGGVGPMTVMALISNLMDLQKEALGS